MGLIAWIAIVAWFWFGLFVPSMRADGTVGSVDLYGYFFPKYLYGSVELARGELPLWNPWEYAGVPFLGVAQPALFYPPRILLFGLLPPVAALHAFMVSHYVLVGLSAFVAFRCLHLALPGAVLGGLIFAFHPLLTTGNYMPLWSAHAPWVLLSLAAFVQTLEHGGIRPMLGLALAATCQVLAGYPEYAVDTALVLTVVWLFALVRAVRERTLRRLVRATAYVASAATLAMLVTSVQWVPLLEAYGESIRVGATYPRAVPLGIKWMVAMGPLLYLPPLGAVLVIAALVARRRPYRWEMLAVGGLALAALTVLGDVPPFAFFRTPGPWFSILHIALAALAGFGLDYLAALGSTGQNRDDARPAWRLLVAGTAVFVVTLLLGVQDGLGWAALVVVGLVLGSSWGRIGRTATVSLTLALAIASLWSKPALHYAQGMRPYPDPIDAERRAARLRSSCGLQTRGRVLAADETFDGVPLVARLPTVQGFPEPLAPARMARLLNAVGLSLRGWNRVNWFQLGKRLHLLSLLDVRCVVAPPAVPPIFDSVGFTKTDLLPGGLVVYARQGASAFAVSEVQVVRDEEASLATILATSFDPGRRVVLEGAGVVGAAGPPGVVAALGEPEPGRHRFHTVIEQDGYLVVSENWYPGWRARVDGRVAPVLRGDFTFLAVPVPAGAHEVELRYVPQGFGAAVAMCAMGVALALVFATVALRSQKQVAAGRQEPV